jgi:SNF2 family DNA or RNA helicase
VITVIKFDSLADLRAKHNALPFQVEAFNAICDLDYSAVFHEQGLGKTKIAIDLLLYWLHQGQVDCALVVTKRGLVENWRRELRQHTHLAPRVLSQKRDANFVAFNSPVRIYLCHYEVLVSEKSRLALFLKTRRVGVILDESHKIKNPTATITRAAVHLSKSFARRVILSGTPIANRPYDIWSQVYFLDHGESLGNDYKAFKSGIDLTAELAENHDEQRRFAREVADIFPRISRFSVRETKAGANIQIPRKSFENIVADWEPRQREMYEGIRQDFRTVVIRDGVPTEDNSEAILKRLMRLVQAASNPQVLDEGYRFEPGKYPVLLDLLDRIVRKNEKAIVWTSFTKNADWLTRRLSGLKAVKVHGQMAMPDRNRSVDVFLNDNTCKVLIATPGAAKEGLTLTVANHVIFFDRSFSLDDYLQAQDRIHRISQKRECLGMSLSLLK